MVRSAMVGYYIERRRWPRVEINALGRISTVSRGLRLAANTMRCKIIDISQGGALLEISSEKIEDTFYLEMDADPDYRATCNVVRRMGNRVGVKFI